MLLHSYTGSDNYVPIIYIIFFNIFPTSKSYLQDRKIKNKNEYYFTIHKIMITI